MTTIACDKTGIYGDLQITNLATNAKFKCGTKVYKFSAHELTYPHSDFYVGFAGSAEDIITAADFFDCPEVYYNKRLNLKGLSGLVLTEQQEIFVFSSLTKWLVVKDKYASIGSGANVAIGAMEAGSTPKEAVKIASKIDIYTGMGIKGYSL